MTIILETYSAKRTAALVGFGSTAMIDYLQRSGVFIPKGDKGRRGRGCGRQYTFRDLLVLKAIKRLLDSGASVSNLKKALAQFQKINWSADPVTMEDPTGIVRYLIASRDGVFLVRDPEILIDLSRRGQLSFSFIVDLEQLRGELRDGLGLPPLQHELMFGS